MNPQNSELFWSMVESLGWGKSFDYTQMQNRLLLAYSPEQLQTYRDEYDRCLSELYRVVDNYVRANPRHSLPYGGDDSFGDMLAHTIGLGRAYYESILESPENLATMNIQESFGYVYPYPDDEDKTCLNYWKDRAKEVKAECLNTERAVGRDSKEKLADEIKLQQLLNILDELIDQPIGIAKLSNSDGLTVNLDNRKVWYPAFSHDLFEYYVGSSNLILSALEWQKSLRSLATETLPVAE